MVLPPAPATAMNTSPAIQAATAAAGDSPAVAAAVANLGLQLPTGAVPGGAVASGPWWEVAPLVAQDDEMSDEEGHEATHWDAVSQHFGDTEVEPLLARAPTVSRSASASPVPEAGSVPAAASAGAGLSRSRSAMP